MGLNSAILMCTFFLSEVKIEMMKNLDAILRGSHLILWRPSPLAITWYNDPQGIDSHFMWTNVISSLLTIHEVFLILAAVLAIVSIPFHRTLLVFTTYCLFLSSGMILRVFVISSILEPSSRLYTTMIRSAVLELENKYKIITDSTYVSTVNTYMINGRCCGVNGPNDFLHVNLSFHKSNFLFPYNPYKGADVYFPPGNVSYTFKFPPACCQPYLFNEGSNQHAFRAVVRCAQGKDISQIKWTGCLHRIEELVKDNHVFITYVLTIMFLLEMTSLMMAVYLSLVEKKRYEDME
ncbi:hypothetical protein RRG08_028887 [Elysia crispata]|uniref:Tetraspanin n=1 Tax=Elysia crispata TaxID=231223 RepID=A0AAE1D7S5_9GAST|nr:hypothetical protein RRG08_028887 [Elysia crispata]